MGLVNYGVCTGSAFLRRLEAGGVTSCAGALRSALTWEPHAAARRGWVERQFVYLSGKEINRVKHLLR